MKNNYTFRKQLGNRGFYIEIIFDVNVLNTSGSDIAIEYLANKRWELMCRAGLLIFHDYFAKKNKGGLEVHIYEIKWMPVDTNNLWVLYASVEALSEALDLPKTGLSFDFNNEIFTFPEPRNF